MKDGFVEFLKFNVKTAITVVTLVFVVSIALISLSYWQENDVVDIESYADRNISKAHGTYVNNLIAEGVEVEYIDELGNITLLNKNNIKDFINGSSNIYIEKIGDNKVQITGSSKGAITITGATSFISINEDVKLFASIYPSTFPQSVQWESSDISIATVDGSGKVVGNAPGQVTITATSRENSSIKGYITIFVDEFTVDEDINITFPGGSTGSGEGADGGTGSIDPGSGLTIVTVTVGDKIPLDITFNPPEVTNKEVKWTSDNPYIASVGSDNMLLGNHIGETKITATSSTGKTQSVLVKVKETVAELSSIRIVGNNNILVGDSTNLVVLYYPSNSSSKDVIWSSSNNAVATVDGSGKVVGVSPGQITITATSKSEPNIKSTHTITVTRVEVPITGITVKDAANKTSGNINSDTDVTLLAIVIPDNSTQGDVIWSSSNRNLVTVDGNGLCSAKVGAKGAVTITATSRENSSVKGTYEFNVQVANVPVTAIRVVAPSHINSGWILNNVAPFQLEAIVTPSNATDKTVTWESSNNSVAIVDNFGNVVPKGSGTVKITARSSSYPNVTGSISLTFIVPEIKAISIAITGGRTPLTIGDTLSLGVNFNPSNTTNKEIVWTVSDPNIISVTSTGKNTATARALKDGWCRIYATASNGVQAQYEVTVNKGNLWLKYTVGLGEQVSYKGSINGGTDVRIFSYSSQSIAYSYLCSYSKPKLEGGAYKGSFSHGDPGVNKFTLLKHFNTPSQTFNYPGTKTIIYDGIHNDVGYIEYLSLVEDKGWNSKDKPTLSYICNSYKEVILKETKDKFVDVIYGSVNQFPEDGVHSDGYWYTLVSGDKLIDAKNLILNPSFESGFTNWYRPGANSSKQEIISGDVKYGGYAFKGVANAKSQDNILWYLPSGKSQATNSITFIDGHKYYFSHHVKNNSTIKFVTHFTLKGNNYDLSTYNTGGKYIKLSVIGTPGTGVQNYIATGWSYETTTLGQNWFIDGLMLVDLTEIFGEGNEPTKEWCDANIAYFEGSGRISVPIK